MRTAEITGNINPKRKILMGLFWANKKAAGNGTCEPFLIEKITTESKIHTPDGNKFLKLSENILIDILDDINENKEVKFKVNFGKEDINISIHGNMFYVSASQSELEAEITEKLELEGKKMYPGICSKFPRRVGINNYP